MGTVNTLKAISTFEQHTEFSNETLIRFYSVYKPWIFKDSRFLLALTAPRSPRTPRPPNNPSMNPLVLSPTTRLPLNLPPMAVHSLKTVEQILWSFPAASPH